MSEALARPALVAGVGASLCLAVLVASSPGCGDGTRIVLGQGAASQAGDAGAGSGGPFGAPTLVAELASPGNNDFKETLTADRLEIYFCSDRPGGPGNQDVWRATRAGVNDPWSAPTLVAEVSSPSTETGPAVSADGLTLWVGSDRPGGKGGLDIWVSTRPSAASAWSTPALVPELSTTGDEFPRPPGESGLVMPGSYRSAPANKYQTFTASRLAPDAGAGDAGDAGWTPPARLTEIDTANIDTDGFLTDDGLTLYFSSDRATAGDQDLYVATRSSTGAPFTVFAPIAELNTAGHAERDPWLSPDGREIYFSSDRSGSLKIYRAAR